MTDADIQAHPPGSRLRSALRSSVGLFKSFNPFNSTGRSGADPRLLDAGTPLRHYVVDGVLDHDELIATYHGHSTGNGREVVIREFLPASCTARAGDLSIVPRADDDGGLFNAGLSHFLREGEIVRDLQHANVVQVLDVFAANRTAYVVTPRERGERLDARRARLGALEDRELVDLAIGVLSGFERLHEAGVVHGQFNETSVVYSEAGVPVIQFSDGAGLATLRKRIRQAVHNGTGARPGMDEVRASVDLYSLSQMLERLSRRPAGEGRPGEVTRGPDSHRPEVLATIGRVLSPDAEQRPDSAARWKMEFEQLRHCLGEADAQGARPAAAAAMAVAAEIARPDLLEETEARTVPSVHVVMQPEPLADASGTEVAAGTPGAEETAAMTGEPAAAVEPVEAATPEPPEAATIVEFPEDAVVDTAGEQPVATIEKTEPVTTLVEAAQPPQLTLADTIVLIPPAAATENEQAPPKSAANGPRPLLTGREQLLRRRIEELESHLRERDMLLERAATHLRQYDAAMKQSRLVFMQRDQREKTLRARIGDLEAQLAQRVAAGSAGSTRETDVQALQRRIAELEAHGAGRVDALARSTQPLPEDEGACQCCEGAAADHDAHEGSRGRPQALAAQDSPLPHVSQAQLLQIREALASEFARNSTMLQVARQEAKCAEADRQRLVEQTELVLADYRNRNSRIRAHEEARILEERRLLEAERDYLRSALQAANAAREQAEQMARKAVEQADRLRNLTTAQIASAEAAVYADLKLVRSGNAPTTQVLAHEAAAPEPGSLDAGQAGADGNDRDEAKIA